MHLQRSDAAESEHADQTAHDGHRHSEDLARDLAIRARSPSGKLILPPANFWKSVPRAAHMVALDIKPSAGGLVTHERMTAYIASKGVNELYADSLEALLRAAARHGQS
jgi:hypothetical protein